MPTCFRVQFEKWMSQKGDNLRLFHQCANDGSKQCGEQFLLSDAAHLTRVSRVLITWHAVLVLLNQYARESRTFDN